MNTIPAGRYQIECVLIDSETVLNNEGVRELEIQDGDWLIQPAEQRFRVVKQFPRTALLSCHDSTYVAEFRVSDDGEQLAIDLKREGVPQLVSIEAKRLRVSVPA